MPRFIETICFEKGNYPLLDLHQERVDRAFAAYFPDQPPHSLERMLPKLEFEEKYKVRIVYDADQADIEYSEHVTREIREIRLIRNDHIDYSHKYEDRSKLTNLFNQKGDADEILIIKNGFVTDSFYANPAFRKGHEWFVPDTYLLNGVRRQHLLFSERVKQITIRQEDIFDFDEISLINALNDLGDIKTPTQMILH